MTDFAPTFGIESLVLTLDDGTWLHVSPAAFGGHNAPFPVGQRLRWVIRDASGWGAVGPVIQSDRSPEAVRALIVPWYEAHRPRDV